MTLRVIRCEECQDDVAEASYALTTAQLEALQLTCSHCGAGKVAVIDGVPCFEPNDEGPTWPSGKSNGKGWLYSLCVLLLAGCGEDITVSPPPEQRSFSVVDDALMAPVRAGLYRWERASGVQRSLSDDGILVYLEADPDCRSTREVDEGAPPRPCNGATTVDDDSGAVRSIRIRASLAEDPSYLRAVVAHELGHALGARSHTESEVDLMNSYAGSYPSEPRITSEALTVLCAESSECTKFETEGQ